MIVICIPIYKIELEWFETVSLEQAFRVFGDRYDICFCVPKSIERDLEKKYRHQVKMCAFPDVYFTSVRSYSELCLCVDFYQCFEEYEYMLLYQLDAFVFSDKLEQFCEMGFDYVGADACDGPDWNRINCSIGNGGFSLRKISSFIRVLSEHKDLLDSHPLRDIFVSKEDVFWGYCGHSVGIDFRIPEIEMANKFAITFGAEFLIEKNDNNSIPFGTHAWQRYDYNFWKSLIENLGYSLPECSDVDYYKTEDIYKKTECYRSIVQRIKDDGINPGGFTSCSIWGAGYKGIKCVRILNLLQIGIKHVYDWNINAFWGVEDISVPMVEIPTYSNLSRLSNDDVLIITTKLDAEIYGKARELNYLLFDDFLDKFIKCPAKITNNAQQVYKLSGEK